MCAAHGGFLMPETPDPLPSLEKLGEKIDKAKQAVTPAPPPPSGYGLVLRVGSELVAGVLVGVGSGYVLDNWLNTKPVFLLLCMLLGTAAGFLLMYRAMNDSLRETTKHETKNDERRP